MIETQLTLEALRVFCLLFQKAGKPANVSQLCRGSVNSSVRSFASFSCFQTVPYTQTITSHLLFGQRCWNLCFIAHREAEWGVWSWSCSSPGQKKFWAQASSWRTHKEGWQKIYIHSFGLKVAVWPIGNKRRNGLFCSCKSFRVRKLNAIA